MTIEYKYNNKKLNDIWITKQSKYSNKPINTISNEKEINRHGYKLEKKKKKYKKEDNEHVHSKNHHEKITQKESCKKEENPKYSTNANANANRNISKDVSINYKKKEYPHRNIKEICHVDKIKPVKESKKEEKQETTKCNQHNHIWYRCHSKSLKEKHISNFDDDISSLEFGWTKKSEIVLPDLRKKEENVYFDNETNENLTNKDFILETLSDYTSDFDECYINEFIDKHKYVTNDNFANKNEFFETRIEDNMDTVKSLQANSRTVTFITSFDKCKNSYGTNGMYTLKKTLRFADTIDLNKDGYETEKEYEEDKKSKYSDVNKLNTNYFKNEDLLSDGIKHYDKKKKNSLFYKSKTRIISMIDYVKRKLSLSSFSKKKNITS